MKELRDVLPIFARCPSCRKRGAIYAGGVLVCPECGGSWSARVEVRNGKRVVIAKRKDPTP